MVPSRSHAVGLRELKNHLSEYVRVVRAGGRVQVTDRGHVVAELLPPGSAVNPGHHEGLAALVRRGVLVPRARNTVTAYSALRRTGKAGRAKRLLDAVRGDR